MCSKSLSCLRVIPESRQRTDFALVQWCSFIIRFDFGGNSVEKGAYGRENIEGQEMRKAANHYQQHVIYCSHPNRFSWLNKKKINSIRDSKQDN